MASFLRKYGTAVHLYIPVVKRAVVDFAVSADWTPAAGDVKISKDGGAAANITTLPVAITMGNTAIWDFAISATEMQAAVVVITVADSATKAVEDQCLIIDTFGNASAQLVVDYSDIVRMGLTSLPNAAAEASGGLYTRGTGAGQINQDANGRIDANVKTWISGAIPAVNVTGVPIVDAKYFLGTIFSTPTVAGIPNVNCKTWNDLTTVALPLIPTVAGRTLDCSAGGEAGLDWANIGSPTTTVGLTNTTIGVVTLVTTTTTVTNQLTAAQVATGIWQDTTSGDFTVASSIGKSLYTSGVVPGGSGGHFIAGTNAATTVTTSFTTTFTGNLTGTTGGVTAAGAATFFTVDSTKVYADAVSGSVVKETALGSGGVVAPSASAIATAVWQDATAGDFTVASSIGKALYIANVAPGGSGGHLISGSNSGTTTLGALTVTGATTLAALSMTTLTASGAVSFGSTFGVTGTVTFNAFTCTNSFLISGTTTHTGSTTFTGAVTATNAANQIGPFVTRVGTLQAGTVAAITLDSGAGSQTDQYKGSLVKITSGAALDEVRTIQSYNGATKACTLDHPFMVAPGAATFAMLAADNPSLNANLQVSAGNNKNVIIAGTAQSGSTANTIKLSAAASATNNIYNGDLITIASGIGVGQVRTIVSYGGASKIATVDKAWNTVPTNASNFEIYASTTASQFSDTGVAQSATASTITLQSTASAVDNVYVGSLLTILSGTDAQDTVEITAYVGATKVATVTPNFAVTPDTTSAYAIIPTQSGQGNSPVTDVNVISWGGTIVSSSYAELVAAVWNANLATYQAAGSTGEALALASQVADPWATALPGAYASGTAGFIVGNLATLTQMENTIWDATMANHLIAGTTGATLNSITTGGVDVNALVAAVWSASVPSSYPVGSSGYILGNYLTSASLTAAQVWSYGTRTLTSTGLDAIMVAGKTMPNAIRYIGATAAGLISGAGTGTEVFKDYNNAIAVTVTVDSVGNRSGIVYS